MIVKGDARTLHRSGADWRVDTDEGPIDAKEAGAAAAIAFATEFKARVVAALADLRGGTWWSSEKTSVAMPTPTRSGGAVIRTFAEGTPFVERDQLAFVHRGEAIIPAGQNALGGISVTIESIDASGHANPVEVGRSVRQGVADAMADVLREQSQRFVAGRALA